MTAVWTISLDPTFSIGPLELAWHGVMTAAGVLVGGWLAFRCASERGLSTEPLYGLGSLIVIAGIVGAKLLFLLQDDPARSIEPNAWAEGGGFSIYGGLVGGGLGAAAWIGWQRLSWGYLDAIAAGLPLGIAVGRIGDLINGEHYGPPSDLPWAIVYTHPESPVPSHDVAYHPGGLYEVVLSLLIFAVLWPNRARFRTPTSLLFTTLAAYAAGRFAMFFWREDADAVAAGLNSAQLESLALLGIALGALLIVELRSGRPAQSQL